MIPIQPRTWSAYNSTMEFIDSVVYRHLLVTQACRKAYQLDTTVTVNNAHPETGSYRTRAIQHRVCKPLTPTGFNQAFHVSISILINGQLKMFQWKLAEHGCANQVTVATKFLYDGA
jgi:hypothetical protein